MTRPPQRLPIIIPLLGGLALFIVYTVVSQIERPPVGTNQRGFRGTGGVDVYNLRTMAKLKDANIVPVSVPYAGGVGPKAGTFYKNVQVLGDVDTGEFTRLMVNMTTWVSAEQGCAGCHNVADFADDSLYTKVAARRMLQMTRYINANWTAHVAQTGVTCYTCHRGQLVPPNVWFSNPGAKQAGGLAQKPAGQNHPSAIIGGTSLPFDPFTPFLEQADDLRVQATTALRTTVPHESIKQAEWTYALMVNMSEALGVNCNFCHMTRSFSRWSQNPPQRVTAWHGIRMVRELNNSHLNPLKSILPPRRLGVLGDAPKVNCATCHNGVHKPLFGVSMAKDFPELKGVAAAQLSPAR
jgi:photosynthetic reaction center cytochrome c subunit